MPRLLTRCRGSDARTLRGGFRTSVRVGEAVQRTINVTVVVALGALAFVPVIVKVNVPRVRPELTVSVDVVPVTLDGLKLAVAPDARPLSDSATAPENPADRATVTA